jgi:hypothetical protein
MVIGKLSRMADTPLIVEACRMIRRISRTADVGVKGREISKSMGSPSISTANCLATIAPPRSLTKEKMTGLSLIGVTCPVTTKGEVSMTVPGSGWVIINQGSEKRWVQSSHRQHLAKSIPLSDGNRSLGMVQGCHRQDRRGAFIWNFKGKLCCPFQCIQVRPIQPHYLPGQQITLLSRPGTPEPGHLHQVEPKL